MVPRARSVDLWSVESWRGVTQREEVVGMWGEEAWAMAATGVDVCGGGGESNVCHSVRFVGGLVTV